MRVAGIGIADHAQGQQFPRMLHREMHKTMPIIPSSFFYCRFGKRLRREHADPYLDHPKYVQTVQNP